MLEFDGSRMEGTAFLPTIGLYKQGSSEAEGTVCAIFGAAEQTLLVVDKTPFYPANPHWLDQPGDCGYIELTGGQRIPVASAEIAYLDLERQLLLRGQEVPSRSKLGQLVPLVVHVLPGGIAAEGLLQPDQVVRLAADGHRRRLLSASHTACHLSALALNRATTHMWTKPASQDSLGANDFDKAAITESKITENGSVDTYRLGKSLRKKGIDADQLYSQLARIESAVTETVRLWLHSKADVVMRHSGDTISDFSTWTCALPEGVAELPCGGTHLQCLAELEAVSVSLEVAPAGELVIMKTTPRLA